MKNKSIDSYDRKARISLMITRIRERLERVVDSALAPYDVTAAQYVVLSALMSGRASTAVEICREISYSAGAMSRMLDRLEQKNLIQRVVSPENHRANKLEITQKGKNIYPELREGSKIAIDELFDSLGDNDLEQLEQLIYKIADKK